MVDGLWVGCLPWKGVLTGELFTGSEIRSDQSLSRVGLFVTP